ncbi:UNVERIFIED_CONTAM: hypothetical protein RMT77_004919 [Armadillidium vulgare]
MERKLPNIKSRLLGNKGKTYHERLEDDILPPRFPYKVFYIIGSEFCERFSFYGLKAVLVLYMSSVLLLNEDSATSLYHGWTFLCYFTPVFGAFLADSFLGRFRTIFYLSVVYLLGNIVLSISSVPPVLPSLFGKTTVSSIGLILIAFGTGGIKPCVSAFGGDQFELPQQEKQLSKFFSVFYFSINAGSLLSTLVTPILREDVTCFGGECFPLAFGVPALLMFVALVIFIVGTPLYRIIPPEGNVGYEVIKCVTYAGCKRIKRFFWRKYPTSELPNPSTGKSNDEGESHWLDKAEERFPKTLIEDVKSLLAVLTLYIPLPLFWALFDQQGSRWTFQAAKLSGTWGSWTIKPDQMQVLNPLLIMFLIPLFQYCVYPLFSRWGLLTNMLRRMILGGLLASLAFVVSGVLQLEMENSRSHHIPEGKISLVFLNTLPCSVKVEISPIQDSVETKLIGPHDMVFKLYDKEDFTKTFSKTKDLPLLVKAKLVFTNRCNISSNQSFFSLQTIIDLSSRENILVFGSYLGNLSLVQITEDKFPQNESPIMRVIDSTDFLRFSPVILRGENKTIEVKSQKFSKGISFSSIKSIDEGSYDVILPLISHSGKEKETNLGSFSTEPFMLILLYDSPMQNSSSEKAMKVFEVSVPSLHMFWLLPQYVLISVGEIMFSITGLEFSFTQAPASMKSVIQAAWLLTTAFGDLFVVIIAKSKLFERQSMEFFLFAVLMALDMIVFYFLSKNFEKNLKERNSQSVVAEELSEGIERSSQHSSQEDESVNQMDKNQTPKVDSHSTLSDGEQMGSSL